MQDIVCDSDRRVLLQIHICKQHHILLNLVAASYFECVCSPRYIQVKCKIVFAILREEFWFRWRWFRGCEQVLFVEGSSESAWSSACGSFLSVVSSWLCLVVLCSGGIVRLVCSILRLVVVKESFWKLKVIWTEDSRRTYLEVRDIVDTIVLHAGVSLHFMHLQCRCRIRSFLCVRLCALLSWSSEDLSNARTLTPCSLEHAVQGAPSTLYSPTFLCNWENPRSCFAIPSV